MHTVVETLAFLHDARALGLSDSERLSIVALVASNPGAGDVIEGTGGARKVFAKNEKTDLTPKERHVLKAILANIGDLYTSKGKSR